MLRRSFRLRLLAWNMVVLLFTLAAVAAAMFFALRAAMHSLVDQELQTRAGQFAATFASGRYGMGMGRGWGMGMGRGMGHGMGSGVDDASSDPELKRLLTFHRPRYFDLQGNGIGPATEMVPWDAKAMAQARTGREVLSNVSFQGQHVRVLSVPLRRDGSIVGVLQVAREVGDLAGIETRLLGIVLALFVPALFFITVSSLFLTRQVLQPVRSLTQAASEIGAGDLSRRLAVGGSDEMTELARTFNGMVERLQTAFAQTQQALEQQQRFTSDVSHELRTPLARLKGVTSFALDGERPAERYREALETADAAADAMTKLVADLLLLARSDSGQLRLGPEPLDVKPFLEEIVSKLGRAGAPVLLDIPAELPPLSADRFHLERVFSNLLDNARRHTPAAGRIMVSAHAENGWMIIRVADSGEGIAAEHLPRISERFYRVDASRTRHEEDGGSGLGLAICHSIVHAHGGDMTIDSTPHAGTTVTLRLPLSPDDRDKPAQLPGT